jgi:hypothetical protein
MEKNRIIMIGVAAAVLLGGGSFLLGKMRGGQGPDCSQLRFAGVPDRPVVALSLLAGDDPTGAAREAVAQSLGEILLVARVAGPIPIFQGKSVPDAVDEAERAALIHLVCGAQAAVWGTTEKVGEIMVEPAPGKKPVPQPVYSSSLWVTFGEKQTRQIPPSRTGQEALEQILRFIQDKARDMAKAKAQTAPPSTPEAPQAQTGAAPSSQEAAPQR